MTSTERARSFKKTQADRGLVQFNVWIRPSAIAELKRAVELINADPDLAVARLASAKTGRLRGLK